MTPQDFCYWLQGALEFNNPTQLDAKQTSIIKDHLKLVFEKKTPEYEKDPAQWVPEGIINPAHPSQGKCHFGEAQTHAIVQYLQTLPSHLGSPQ